MRSKKVTMKFYPKNKKDLGMADKAKKQASVPPHPISKLYILKWYRIVAE